MSIFIGKWDGKSDFQQWALPLISALRVYGLDVYLNPNYPFPGSVQEQFLYSQNSFLVFYVLQRHLPSTDAAVINLFTSHPNPALRAWTYLVRNHCPSTPEMLHNLEVQLKGEKMQEKETARDYISKKIALRLEIERKGGVIPDVAFMVAVLKGLPDHPRFHNLKDNLLDSAELYRTDLGDLCNRIIRVAQSVYGTDYSVGSRSVSAPSLPSILGELHPLGTGPSGSSLSVSDLSVNSARVMQGQMTGSSSSSGQYTPRFSVTIPHVASWATSGTNVTRGPGRTPPRHHHDAPREDSPHPISNSRSSHNNVSNSSSSRGSRSSNNSSSSSSSSSSKGGSSSSINYLTRKLM